MAIVIAFTTPLKMFLERDSDRSYWILCFYLCNKYLCAGIVLPVHLISNQPIYCQTLRTGNWSAQYGLFQGTCYVHTLSALHRICHYARAVSFKVPQPLRGILLPVDPLPTRLAQTQGWSWSLPVVVMRIRQMNLLFRSKCSCYFFQLVKTNDYIDIQFDCCYRQPRYQLEVFPAYEL